MCEEYLLNFHKNDLEKILADGDATKHFSIDINFIVLYEHQADIAVELLKSPDKCLEEWDTSTVKAQLVLLKKAGENASLKIHVHCRIYQLPGLSEVCRTIFPGNDDAGKFLQVSGTVMRMSASKLLEYQRVYICTKCKYSTLVKAEYDRKYIIKQPKKCQNPEDCSSTNLIVFGELDSDNCKDYQEVKIQERVKKLGLGCMPNTMCVTLEDNLVDSCKPGDNVTICGIVKRRWGEFSKGCKIDIDIVLKANNVQVDNNSSSAASATPEIKQMFSTFWEKYSGNPLIGRDLILKSFCPQIYGLYLVKLAIIVVLAGGSRVDDTESTGVRTRSESHLLLVGDPGTGKSQLLRFASKIIPRSVLTTGVGSTAAGLTVTALMERGEWQLEGGALVLSDGGICCIDEFNSMKEHDRTSIHEAMEQQTISVAKASIVCKLNTRCSVLAACNPKGNLDISQPLCMNVALPSPLLSRFDLILLLRDAVNEEWDTQIVDYILNCGNRYSKLTESSLWNVDILQSYFAIIRKFHPKLSEDAERILSEYYQMQRRIDSRNKARTTVRLLESLVRLSQGHARLMYHDVVETMDSIYAIVLVDAAMEKESSILDLNVTTYSIFPEFPWRDYRGMVQAVLTRLGLQNILAKEIASLNVIKDNEWSENVKSRFFNNRHRSGENIDISDVSTGETKRPDFVEEKSTKSSLQNKREEENRSKRPKSPEDGNKEIKKIRTVELRDMPNTSSKSNEIYTQREIELNKNYNTKINKSESSNNKEAKVKNKVTNRTKKDFSIADEDLDLEFDEGYDTLSFGASDTPKDPKSKGKKSTPKRNVSLNQSKSVSKTNSLQEVSENNSILPDTVFNSKPSEPEKNERTSSITSVNEETLITKIVADGTKQSSIKDRFKKFKFVPKDVPVDSTDIASNSTDTKIDDDIARRGKENVVNKETEDDGSDNFIKEDLEMLKMLPSVNDDLNIDLDFDWDNLDSKTNTFNRMSKKKIVKKLSSATISSMSRTSSSLSSQSSRTNIFTSSENVDDLDLEI